MRPNRSRFAVAVAAVLSLLMLGPIAQAPAGGVAVKVSGSGQTRVGKSYTITVNAKKSGKAAKGTVTLDCVMKGITVRNVARNAKLRGGRWSVTQEWPKIAKGQTMTFKATVNAGGSTGTGAITVKVRG
ncbi:MAG: hypothetical protein JHC95_22000 [Solirubrobacteraceae bacterium]|nr:hypothetical protein [Solirubrobacteraceae bacterium]